MRGKRSPESETLPDRSSRDDGDISQPIRTAPLPAATTPGAERLDPGTSIGRYVVIEKLGAGGGGDVYVAYDKTLDRKVALKLLRSDDPTRRPMLLREAHAMAKLSHPNVVAVFDAGLVDDRVFIAMELVEGRTLRQWQREERPDARAVLRAYVRGGQGLAAAHAAGLVHRDFKPANVLISDAGDVKVTDFGVASLGGSPASSDGVIVGTPGYMAPEQELGLAVDERSDQFSFCVALFEALYGERPFDDDHRADAIARGSVAEPSGARVSASVRRALVRGLQRDPESRFPSLAALLDALQRDPSRRTRRVIAIASSAAVIAGAIAWGRHELTAQRNQMCTGGNAEAAETWNDDTRRRIEKALVDTGASYAEDTWRRTRDQVDAYMARWATMHRQTCEATRVRGEQSEQLMSLRMVCLERRREEVRALGHALEAADRNVASHAVQAAMELTSLETCADVGSLTAGEPEPTDPAKRTELTAIRSGLAEVKANLDAGRAAAAREVIDTLVARAQALGFQSALAEALLLASVSKADSGSWERAAADARSAVLAAEAARDDRQRAMAEITLLHWLTETGRLDEAQGWSELADATLRRNGDQGEARVEWLDASGWLLYRQGKNVEARDRLRAGLESARRIHAIPQRISKLARALADDEAALGNYEEAQRLVDEADQTLIDAVGSEHPSRIPVLVNRSVIAARANKRKDELAYARQAIALALSVAPEHSALGVAYLDACDALLRLRDYETALGDCTKAVTTNRRVYGANATYVAYADTTMGDVLVGLNRFAEAATYYEDAVSIHEKSGTRGDSDYADALRGLGTSRLRTGKSVEACAFLERALAAIPKSPPASAEESAMVASIDYALAQALWTSGTRTARVGDLARGAIEAFRQASDEDDALAVERWAASRAVIR